MGDFITTMLGIPGLSGLLQGLGIKGKTQHLTYDHVAPIASIVNRTLQALLTTAQKSTISQAVKNDAIALMRSQTWWRGAGGSIANDIANDSATGSQLFDNTMWRVFVWVGTSVPSDIFATEFPKYADHMVSILVRSKVTLDAPEGNLTTGGYTPVGVGAVMGSMGVPVDILAFFTKPWVWVVMGVSLYVQRRKIMRWFR